ncbi:helix-turn-helix transcriptional regulator [Plantactinospora sp. DSM 117369]
MTGPRSVMPPLVGRDDDLDRLVSVVSASPAVVAVEGEAGIGKTRLVTELMAHPLLAGRRVLVGACRQIREPFPLGPLVEAVRGLGEALAGVELSPVAGALRPLLPELTGMLPPPPEPVADRATRRHQVFRGLVEVLGAVGPAILVIEDLHWADEQSVEFLDYLVSVPPSGLSIVLTMRGEEAAPRVRAVTVRLPETVRRAWIALAPLDPPATGTMAAAMLGIDRVSEEFAVHLCQRASGLPLAIQELVALLHARGTLIRHDGGWARRVLSDLDVPAGIRDPVRERVSRLGSAAKAVVEAAAVLQTPFPESLLLSVARLSTADATDGLTEGLASGLLADYRPTTVGFRHVLAAQAVYGGITGPRQRELHARAAEALRELRPMPAGQVAHHLRRAGRLTEWVAAAEIAADQAVALGDDAEAVRLLAEVLRHAPLDTARQGHIAVKLGRAALESLRQDPEVIDLLTAALEHDQPAAVRGELRFALAILYDAFERHDLQRELFAEALADLADRPELKAWAMVGLGIPRSLGVPAAEHQMWLHRALQILPEVANPVVEVFLLGKVAMVLAPMGDPQWRPVTDRIVRCTGGTPRHPREVNAYHSVALDACRAGHHAVAARLLDRAREGAATAQNELLELRIQIALALLDYCQGRWGGLGERVEPLIEAAKSSRNHLDGEVVAGCLALANGDLDRAESRLTRLVRQLERHYAFDVLAIPVAASARLAVARGDPDQFLAGLDRFVALTESSGVWASAVRALPSVLQALVAAGRVDQARLFLIRFARQLRGLDVPLARAALHHARGFLDAAERRWPAGGRHFLAAAERYESLLCPYEAAQAREQAAMCLFEVGDPRAEEVLRTAMTTFDGLGARWDLERAASIARQWGMSLPARHRGGPRGYGSALSPREREVADLAATGRTNREIAAELFLSPKTVDKHLSAALRKLGLRTRTALARHLRDAVDG